MNLHELENGLKNAPETTENVDEHLHRDIMRSVRLADTRPRAQIRAWAGPVMGGALAVMLLSFLHLSSPVVETSIEGPLAANAGSSLDVFKLGEKLKALSNEPRLTENQLKMEFERLKSDLKRFDFRS